MNEIKDNRNNQDQQSRPRANVKLLKTEDIFRYFMNVSEELDTLIMCKPDNLNIVATDQALYEALGSLPDPSEVNHRKLIKLLESVDVFPLRQKIGKRIILTEGRVEDIRNSLKGMIEKVGSEQRSYHHTQLERGNGSMMRA